MTMKATDTDSPTVSNVMWSVIRPLGRQCLLQFNEMELHVVADRLWESLAPC